MSGSTQGYHFNNIGGTRVPDATYQILRPSLQWKILKVLPYVGVTGIVEHIFVPLAPGSCLKFGYN